MNRLAQSGTVSQKKKSSRDVTASFDPEFARAVLEGLSSDPKYLPSKYLYDSRGDKIFQQIMDLPEYYLSRCEEEILKSNKDDLLNRISGTNAFSLVELGPGDGKKTKILLSHFIKHKARFSYHPIDISTHALDELSTDLKALYPRLQVEATASDYFLGLEKLAQAGSNRKLVLFLGGNIGNFSKKEATGFLQLLSARLNKGDLLLAGFDLKKDPAAIYHAYNDRQGVTRSFNFNLLRRINRELSADFDASHFMHYPTYDPNSGEMKSFLIAEKAHKVHLQSLGKEISFEKWEPIFMEVSNKYSIPEIKSITGKSGLRLERIYTDKKEYYVNVLLSKQ